MKDEPEAITTVEQAREHVAELRAALDALTKNDYATAARGMAPLVRSAADAAEILRQGYVLAFPLLAESDWPAFDALSVSLGRCWDSPAGAPGLLSGINKMMAALIKSAKLLRRGGDPDGNRPSLNELQKFASGCLFLATVRFAVVRRVGELLASSEEAAHPTN